MLNDYVIDSERVDVSSADGFVHTALKKSDSSKVAIKFNLNNTPTGTARFTRENEILFDLIGHNGIVKPLTGVCREKYEGYEHDLYVMEGIDTAFDKWVLTKDGNILSNKINVFIQICEALKYAHEYKYIHRDLHYQNILMNLSPTIQIKLIDFGRAFNLATGERLTNDTPIWGGLVMPPEIRFGQIDVPSEENYYKADIFSLGIIWKYLFDSHLVLHQIGNIVTSINKAKNDYMINDHPESDNYYSIIEISKATELYNLWLQSEDVHNTSIYDIKYLPLETGDKLSIVAKSLLHLDSKERINSVDDIINLIKVLQLV